MSSHDEKEQLLEEYERHQKKEANLEPKLLLMMFALLFLAIALVAPKIYLRNNIYFVSKDIYKLQTEKDSLEEEHRKLKRELEDMKFRHLVTDIEF